MAHYDYRCTSCSRVFEVEHAMKDRPGVSCPACGAPAERVFSASGIEFKGSGFYNTDQRGCSPAAQVGSAPGGSCESCPHKGE